MKGLVAEKRVGNLIIYDVGDSGLFWKRVYTVVFLGKEEKHEDFHAISNDDMVSYTMEELLPWNFKKTFSEEEQAFFIAELTRKKATARHSDYYDAFDNTWKNYD